MSNIVTLMLGMAIVVLLVFKDEVYNDDNYYKTKEECVIAEKDNCAIGILFVYVKE